MKNLLNRKLFELFELFDKKVRNYSLFDKFLNPYLNPSLIWTLLSWQLVVATTTKPRLGNLAPASEVAGRHTFPF
jgi:hypothetical protein